MDTLRIDDTVQYRNFRDPLNKKVTIAGKFASKRTLFIITQRDL
jgi:hypothetical protein